MALKDLIQKVKKQFMATLPTPSNFRAANQSFNRQVAQPVMRTIPTRQNIQRANQSWQNQVVQPTQRAMPVAKDFMLGKLPIQQRMQQWEPKNKWAKMAFNPKEYNQGINDINQGKITTQAAQSQALNAGFMSGGVGNKAEFSQIAKEIAASKSIGGIKSRTKQILGENLNLKNVPKDVWDYLKKEVNPKKVQDTLELMRPESSKVKPPIPKPGEVGGVKPPVVKPTKPVLPETPLNTSSNILDNVQQQSQDKFAPIINAVGRAAKEAKLKINPSRDMDVLVQKAMSAEDISTVNMERNGFNQAVKDVQNLDGNLTNFNEFLTARHAQEVSVNTGRDVVKDKAFIAENGPKYEEAAKKVTAALHQTLDNMADSGVISKKLAEKLKVKYPNYVPLDRVFEEVKNVNSLFKSKPGLAEDKVIQRLQGSEKAIEDPLNSAFTYMTNATKEIEKNNVITEFVSHKDLSGMSGLIKETTDNNAPNMVSYLVNGTRKMFQTTPEIAKAFESFTPKQLGLTLRITSKIARMFKIGTTVINPKFVYRNLIRDQLAAFVNSNRGLNALKPGHFLKAFGEALNHGKDFEEMMAQGAARSTSFDIARKGPARSIEEIASHANTKSRIKYEVRHPGELWRAVEDAFAVGEQFTRIQQFKSTRDVLLKQGFSAADAAAGASKQSRRASTDFSRVGTRFESANMVVPYLNAGIQGSKTLMTALKERPLETSTKIIVTTLLPMAYLTMQTLSDPNKRRVYNDLLDFEKENNFIIIPDNAQKDDKGQWNVVKVPISQELANLANLVRRGVEQAHGGDPIRFAEVAKDLIGSATSLDVTNTSRVIGQVTPQLAKFPTELMRNKSMFTGKPIVPENMTNMPKDQQVYSWSSGTARLIGKSLNMSPIAVEYAAKSLFGTYTPVITRFVDKGMAKAGFIPKDQVGGAGLGEDMLSGFTKAYGGQTMENVKKNGPTPATQEYMTNMGSDKEKSKLYFALRDRAVAGLDVNQKAAYDTLHPTKKDSLGNVIYTTPKLGTQQKALIYKNNPALLQLDTALAQESGKYTGEPVDPLFKLSPRQQNAVILSQAPLPGESADLKKQMLYNQPWYADYAAERQTFFQDIAKKKQANGETPAQSDYPSITPQMKAKQDAFFILADGKSKQAYLLKNPDLLAYWDSKDAYTNGERAQLGMPAMPADNGGFKPWPKTIPKMKVAAKPVISMPKITATKRKVSMPKLKVVKPSNSKITKSSLARGR